MDTVDSRPYWERLFRDLVAIARPDHWFKNIFMVPGIALAALLVDDPISYSSLIKVVLGVFATCLIASANYSINEWLDRDYDRHHKTKKSRPAVVSMILTGPIVYTQWAVLSIVGLAIAYSINGAFFTFATCLLIMGLAYNVEPIRTKDKLYLDVLSESINNPLRFMLGWSIFVPTVLPPSSILLAYWMGGAFLMAIKRFAEFRHIGDHELAGRYRKSFISYDEKSLLVSAVFYGLAASLFLGVFIIKYRIEFLLLVPFLALLFSWYLAIGMRDDSISQRPEQLYSETPFVIYVLFLGVLTALLFVVDMPWLNILVETRVLGGQN